jgi:F-type H+-transporting ATPase subunit delta
MASINEITSLSKRYAKAAFELALKGKSFSKVTADIANFIEVVEGDQALAKTLQNPSVKKETLVKIVEQILSALKAGEVSKGFIKVIAKNRRVKYLPKILEVLKEKINEHEGVVSAQVFSVVGLEASEVENISKAIAKKLGKKVEISNKVDETLVGGVKIQIGSKLFDDTVKGKLERLSLHLAQ